MRWRNGGGTTSEIAAQGQDGVWRWRLSTAIVAQDGPYSRFPGLTRISTVIAGAGTDITDTGGPDWQRIAPLAPTRIEGDRQIQGRLVDGPIRFLNLFFDPRHHAARVSVIRLDGKRRSQPQTDMVFCVEGRCALGAVDIGPMDLARDLPAHTPLSGQAVLLAIALDG